MRSLALALVLLAVPAAAFAQAPVTVQVRGARSRMVERQLVRRLESAGVQVVDGASARVRAQVARRRRGWQLRVGLEDASGGVVTSRNFDGRSLGALTRSLGRWVDGTLAPAIQGLGAAPPAPEPERPRATRRRAERARPAPPPEEDDEEPAAASSFHVPPFAFHTGVAVGSRSLTYTDDLFSALRPYDLPVAPFVRLALEWFPGAHFDSGAFAGFSVVTRGEAAFGVQSIDGNGVAYPTEAWSFGVDLRYRLRVDDVTFGVTGGYGTSTFALRDGGELSPRPDIPNVEYHLLRAGGSFRWDIGLGIFLDAEAAYLHPLAAGEITSAAWFPRAEVGGLDGAAGVGLRIDDVQIAARFEIQRFWYDMHVEPGDARVAGGAIDQRLSGAFSLVYTPSGL